MLLNGITKLDVTAAMSESVNLEGIRLERPELSSTMGQSDTDIGKETISWGMDALLTATPAKTVIILERSTDESNTVDDDDDKGWNVIARAGIVPSSMGPIPDTTPILDRVGSIGNVKETYLPTVQALPGKRELTYLPTNIQLALLIPIQTNAKHTRKRILVLGSNTAKSFSPRDVAWSRIIAYRMCIE